MDRDALYRTNCQMYLSQYVHARVFINKLSMKPRMELDLSFSHNSQLIVGNDKS